VPFSAIKTYARQVYLPSALVRAGDGMLAAALPLWLLQEGLSASLSSLVLAAGGAGAVVAVLPMGALLARHPVRDILRWVGMVAAIALALLAAAPVAVVLLLALRMVGGGSQIAWMKGQETYLFRRLDPIRRGRSMSALAATNRVAFLVGPALGGFIAREVSFDACFLAAATSVAIGTTVMLPSPAIEAARLERMPEQRPHAIRDVIAAHRRTLVLLGAGQLCAGALRLGFVTLLAFRGDAIDLSATQVGLTMSTAFLFDLLLFPVAGRIMDLRGRLHAIVPAFGLLAIAAAAVGMADSYGQLLAVGVLGGIANGLSNGTLLTLNSDLAPADAPGQFLAAVGFVAALGDVVGPLLVGAMTDALSLGAAGIATAALGLTGVGLLWFGVGETRHLAHAPQG
jgi:MFS family permease